MENFNLYQFAGSRSKSRNHKEVCPVIWISVKIMIIIGLILPIA